MRRRSPSIIQNHHAESIGEISFAIASSNLMPQHQKYRSTTQLTDRSSTSHRHQQQQQQQQQSHHPLKIIRAQSRNHSSSSDERIQQPAAISPLSSNDTSDEDDPNSILSHHSRLRRKYLKSSQTMNGPTAPSSLSRQQSMRDQQSPSSPVLRYASNGVLLRSKPHHYHQFQQQQQQQSIPQQIYGNSIFNSSSKDFSKQTKRYSLDAAENRSHNYQNVPHHPQGPESSIYRSAMAIAPSQNNDGYGNQTNNQSNSHHSHHNTSITAALSVKQIPTQHSREESHYEFTNRTKVIQMNRRM